MTEIQNKKKATPTSYGSGPPAETQRAHRITGSTVFFVFLLYPYTLLLLCLASCPCALVVIFIVLIICILNI